ncbi:hypothetical protein BKA00_004871 [Actinomadura coerulea]|uniref:DUF6891 domain-containing protein n=1 Tax=Actinomadura coerulea TaxID=46159 RepID=A0A7X0G3B4_9ACTN|nr:hypothetical protein [Actinomadura coerulea]MBB6397957.1 hypothetical protein [Actinomadura coerulea]GGQ33217.1 hypothetical protein GCM10010187_57810 [Actinomadura coerulea]
MPRTTDTPLTRLRAYAANLDEGYEDIDDLVELLDAHAEEHDLTVSPTELHTIAASTLIEAKTEFLLLLGYSGHDEPISPEDIVDQMVEMVEDAGVEYSQDAIEDTVDALWNAQVEEQRKWPEVTDNDLLERAFTRLWRTGIVAEENFTCCQSCGVTEIGGQIPEGSVMDGYTFFHEQDTESVLFDDELLLSYGTFGPESEPQKAVEVGERVVAALKTEGLRVEWDGSPAARITVFMKWRKRLVG